MRQLFFLFISLLSFLPASAQETIKGKIKAADGHGVEYATVSVDSIFTMSDAEGNFSLFVPKGHTQDLHISHISYKTLVVPRSKCHAGSLNLTLEEAVNELANVTVKYSRKNKQKAVSSKGVRFFDMCFKNEQSGVAEAGPIVKASKDFVVDNVALKVLSNSYTKCTLRVIIYELKGKKVTPIQTKPLYVKAKQSSGAFTVEFTPQQQILLKKGHRYVAGLSIVESSKEGTLMLPAYLHSGVIHNTLSGKLKKIPATVGLQILGRS